MAIVTFAAGDKDYIAKLNQMSQNSGDTEAARLAAEAARDSALDTEGRTEVIRQQTETIRDQVTALATGDLVFVEVGTSREVAHGDLILAATSGIEFTTNTFKAGIVVGQWFTIENTSNGTVFVKSRSDLSFSGSKGSVTNGDRLGISPGNSLTFRAISATELRVR